MGSKHRNIEVDRSSNAQDDGSQNQQVLVFRTPPQELSAGQHERSAGTTEHHGPTEFLRRRPGAGKAVTACLVLNQKGH
jgi:hypothetical protein